MSSPLTAQDVLSAAEVAELLRMPTSTVEHLARQGTLPSRKIGRRRLFVRQQVEAVLLGEPAISAAQEPKVVQLA
jgi:excisionase family DNA binding protein